MIDIEVKGLIEAQRKIAQAAADLHGRPMVDAMRDATLMVTRYARQDAPVDTGRLRASITPDVRVQDQTIIGVVGSNVAYAPFMELGTRPHWVPAGALDVWARRHGMTAFVVARAIARRGLAARRFLQGAVEKAADWIVARFERAIKEIVE